MPLSRLLGIMAAVLVWFAMIFVFPWIGMVIGREVSGPGGAMVGGALSFVLFLVGTIVGTFYGLTRSARLARERVQRDGVRCTAFVKSYRRISMTQHRVLWVVQFPNGLAGREYTLEGLSDAWLADVCALGRPVSVIAHPDAQTLIVEA
ncbi:MAG: hypothetical protein U0325_07640 [Polyangiales bacterium]